MIDTLSGIQPTAAALQAERIRMDVAARNIANAHTTRDAGGEPYQRQRVVFESALASAQAGISMPIARVETDPRPPRLIHQPGHPDAGPDGMVALPNVNIHEEMAGLLSASRAFEANLTVVKTARQLALQTLAISRR